LSQPTTLGTNQITALSYHFTRANIAVNPAVDAAVLHAQSTGFDCQSKELF
jgi:hypothetical protein